MKETYRALIVDDEAPARSELRFLLGRHARIKVVGEASGADEALALAENLSYDVVFLDINLPESDGLEVASRLAGLADHPYVVFVTAYSEFAVRAFEVSAFDYLLKPVTEKRIDQTVDRLLTVLDATTRATGGQPARLERLAVSRSDKTVLLDLEQIYYFQAEGDYTRVVARAGSYLANYSLKSLEERLDPKLFFRCHRSSIVNLTHVSEIVSLPSNTYGLRLRDERGTVLPLSRRQTRELRKRLEF
ncbi:MAG: LytTR family DNA-binding domain-containing protein [Actinobacteria bacterium]|nr:LytTR family DNA-binding domain-containing protein [Actinomycetota bacterium]